jgi:hypothetical protein
MGRHGGEQTDGGSSHASTCQTATWTHNVQLQTRVGIAQPCPITTNCRIAVPALHSNTLKSTNFQHVALNYSEQHLTYH